MARRILPSEIQYWGGSSSRSLSVVEMIVLDDESPQKATLVTNTEIGPYGPELRHLFLFWNWRNVLLTVVSGGLTSGFGGKGPSALSSALCLLRSKELDLDLKEADAATFLAIDSGQADETTIESVRYRDSAGQSEDYIPWIHSDHLEKVNDGTFLRFFLNLPEELDEVGGLSSPTAFISYSWDSEGHKQWVSDFATALRKEGIDVKLDQWHLRLGYELTQFIEVQIRQNDFVIVVCTPEYKHRSDNRLGGVGYETSIIAAEVFDSRSVGKFIPVLRSGTREASIPAGLSSRRFVDLSDANSYQREFEELVDTLHGKPLSPPAIGDHFVR